MRNQDIKEDIEKEETPTIKDLMEEIAKLKEDSIMLKDIADKARMSSWESKKEQDKTRVYSLSLFEGKVIVAWRTVSDDVYQDTNGRWHEKQVMELVTEDGKKHEMDYNNFVRLTRKIKSKFISKTVDSSGHETLKLLAENGKEYEIDSSFIN